MADVIEIGMNVDTSDLAAGLAEAVALIRGMSGEVQQIFATISQDAQRANDGIVRGARAGGDKLQKEWTKTLAPITRAFDSAISGMILGTTSLQQAMLRIGQAIVTTFVNNVIKQIVDKWIIAEFTKTAATDAGNAARTASNAAAGAAGAAAGAASAKQSVVQHAWSSAAAVFDDVAQIPYVGWILAPPAAAAAAAAVLAFGSNIPGFAVGAWNLPSDTLARLHAGETVLPADFASGFRAALAGGGAGGGSYNITIQAIDTQSGAQFLKNNAKSIVSALQSQARNFNPALRQS